MSTPYYEDAFVRLFCGDARDVLPSLEWEGAVAVITDPVWPNAHPDLIGAADPLGLFTSTLPTLPEATVRLAVWLGVQSDPRFLASVPVRWPFLRACYLRRAVPSYNGRCLVSGDVLYGFGAWPPSRPGRRVIPGEASATTVAGRRQPHPCARNAEHASWVVRFWSDQTETVLDPFAGTGTILVAAKLLGTRSVGVEISEQFCEVAAERLGQGVLDFGGVA